MVEAEPGADKDEPSTSVNGKDRDRDAPCNAEVEPPDNAAKREKQKEVDEFGLPVQKLHRRSDSSLATSDDLNSRSNGNGTYSTPPDTLGPQAGHDEVKEASRPTATDEKAERRDESIDHDQPAESTKGIQKSTANRLSEVEILSPTSAEHVLQGNTGVASEWSHQALAPQKVDTDEKKTEDEWQTMPSYAPFDLYDDEGHLVAKEAPESDEEANAYHGLGGAGKGYTRVQNDEDAQSATSMDGNTGYLFKPKGTDLSTEDDEQRDPMSQLQATKELLTEGQRIAYVGITRLAMAEMVSELEKMDSTRTTKKLIALATESTKMWSQKIMVRLYKHMDISSSGKYTRSTCL